MPGVGEDHGQGDEVNHKEGGYALTPAVAAAGAGHLHTSDTDA